MSEYKEALENVGGLSTPGKMPCRSWSTPAQLCPLGSKLRNVEGSTCSGCYALKGFYFMPNVQEALNKRAVILRKALSNPKAARKFVDSFVTIFKHRSESTRRRLTNGQTIGDDGRYFRWHDSGDIWSIEHFTLLCAIAQQVPEVEFWLPTREAGIISDFVKAGGIIPDNFMVRVSVPRINDVPSGVLKDLMERGLVTASGVTSNGKALKGSNVCPAYNNDGKCGDCRACWDNKPFIVYELH